MISKIKWPNKEIDTAKTCFRQSDPARMVTYKKTGVKSKIFGAEHAGISNKIQRESAKEQHKAVGKCKGF